ncbi:MAG TPA: hypothetical protein VK633_09675 [Verrucomicrobiae bacterium]|nr:hypothetical protein [Verrucomicrobiae bacterium]
MKGAREGLLQGGVHFLGRGEIEDMAGFIFQNDNHRAALHLDHFDLIPKNSLVEKVELLTRNLPGSAYTRSRDVSNSFYNS